jgi:hypothetical protein
MAMTGAIALLNLLLGKRSPDIPRHGSFLTVYGDNEKITF